MFPDRSLGLDDIPTPMPNSKGSDISRSTETQSKVGYQDDGLCEIQVSNVHGKAG